MIGQRIPLDWIVSTHTTIVSLWKSTVKETEYQFIHRLLAPQYFRIQCSEFQSMAWHVSSLEGQYAKAVSYIRAFPPTSGNLSEEQGKNVRSRGLL